MIILIKTLKFFFNNELLNLTLNNSNSLIFTIVVTAALVFHRTLHIIYIVLCPLIDGVLALATVCREVGESLLESQTEDAHINVVAELLSRHEEVMTEDESSEKINDVGTTGRQGDESLIQEDDESECRCNPVELESAKLLEDNVKKCNMQGEVHVVRGAVWSCQRVETGILP